VLGPRVFTAGGVIDGIPATDPGATGVATPDEARHAVDARAVAVVDFVGIQTKITPALLTPLMDEASTLRIPVAANLGKIDALTAARAGVTSLEHLSGVVQAARTPATYFRAHDLYLVGLTAVEAGWGSLDSAAVARTARALAATRVAIVPTLALHETFSRLSDTALLSRPGMSDVPADAREIRDVAGMLSRTGWQLPDFIAFRRSRARQDQFVREFKRAGGLVAAGSAAGERLLPPGGAIHEEMARLVAAGFTPIEAIAAATRRGAQLLRADSLGMVAPGKVADLVVLNAAPQADIAATRNIHLVMLRGHWHVPDSLRAQWRAGP
jgi:imidazolonepropionase-like amidohydrolase